MCKGDIVMLRSGKVGKAEHFLGVAPDEALVLLLESYPAVTRYTFRDSEHEKLLVEAECCLEALVWTREGGLLKVLPPRASAAA